LGIKSWEKSKREAEMHIDSILAIAWASVGFTLVAEGVFFVSKEIKSVANVSRKDINGFIELADKIPIIPETQEFKLEEANRALLELKERKIRGAKVLVIG
jgi:D-arabinose 1-dehydrogenase-like Zn-dependent alcohol dehydrogenase